MAEPDLQDGECWCLAEGHEVIVSADAAVAHMFGRIDDAALLARARWAQLLHAPTERAPLEEQGELFGKEKP